MVIDDYCSIPRTCTVLGGRGFVGKSLVLKLLQLGKWIVRVADSLDSLHLDPSESESLLSRALNSGRASYFCVDVRDQSQIAKAIEGSSVVFYMDATDLCRHDFYHCYLIIVQGAKNVINACRECKVRQLIYNSSADVVFDGSLDISNGDESLPYSFKDQDMLNDLKTQAEALVLFANNIDGLLTCALRPCNVFGPGDTQLLPSLVNQAKSGWAKFIIGNGENMSDFTYVENVVHAHICAEEALGSKTVSVAGKAFFITNLEPVNFWEFVSLMLEGVGYQRPFIRLPPRMVWYIHSFLKWTHEKLGSREHSSVSARYIFQIAPRTRTFDCTAAQKCIGYSPVVSMDEGVALTIDSFSHLAGGISFARLNDFNGLSKVDKLLGSGKVADILLWRDEKETFTYFLVLVLLFYWFFLCGRTFISSAAKLLLLLTIFLSGHGILPFNIFGFTVRRMPFSSFLISESVVNDSVTTITNLWNRGVHITRSLAQGEDWNLFFKVSGSLFFLKLISSHSLTLLIGVALVFAFTLFFVYEQYEPEIEGLFEYLLGDIKKFKALLTRNLPSRVASFLHNNRLLHQEKGPAVSKDRQ